LLRGLVLALLATTLSSIMHQSNRKKTMLVSRRHSLALIAAVAALPAVAAFTPDVHAETAQIYSDKGIAIDGTDPVSYFKQGKPVAESSSITHKWKGVTWRFSSEDNRAAFAANPTAYAPQYGGYCAYAVSEGYTASTVPDAWKIVDGKLYLNYSRGVQRTWERNYSQRIVDRDAK